MSEANKPHKWQKEIIAWANGAQIQYRIDRHNPWIKIHYPNWKGEYEYRVMPEAPPDFECTLSVNSQMSSYEKDKWICSSVNICTYKQPTDNNQETPAGYIHVVFDGTSGVIKSVELLN